jgi:uncharacterized membrane protein
MGPAVGLRSSPPVPPRWFKPIADSAEAIITMIEVTTSIDVHRPVLEVFGYVSNVFNMPKWNPHISEVMVDAPGPLMAGSRFRVLGGGGSQSVDVTFEVTHFSPNRRLAATARAEAKVVSGITVEEEGWVAFRTTRDFVDLGGSTRVELYYVVDRHPFGGLTGWSDRILKRRTQRDLDRQERNLKRCIESSAATAGALPA